MTSTVISGMSSLSDTYCWEDDDKTSANNGEQSSLHETPAVFGRAHETKLLSGAFQQVLRTKCTTTVVVHGESGVGKTCLVDTLRLPVIQNDGYFCAGKFFQNSSVQEPYSALMAAFSDMCDLVIQSDDFNEKRQHEIQQALETDGHLLTTAISNILPLLDQDALRKSMVGEGVAGLLSENSLSKFKVACKTLLKAVATDEHPLVLFIDDIQWMDIGSTKLIEQLLNDAELKNVLLILAYRDEEAEQALSLLRGHDDLIDIPVKKLDSSAVREMVCSITGSNSESLREFSSLTEERSQGNPFHLQEFLTLIQREGLLTYNDENDTWMYDTDHIRSKVMVRANLADLLSLKIDLVSDDIKDTLKVASLFGYSFNESVLVATASAVMGDQHTLKDGGNHQSVCSSSTTVTRSLQQAVKIGFVEKIKGGFQFTHDKIQTAFEAQITSDEEVERIQKIIGETILSFYGDDHNATMYHAVVHLNAAPGAIVTEEDLYRLVRINLRASKYCISKSGFSAAGDLLKFALESMGRNQRWCDPFFGVTFEMTELLAKAELVIGNFDGCKAAIEEAIRHGTSNEMNINSMFLDLEVKMANNELDMLVPSANRVLQALGVKMPRRVTSRHVMFMFLRLKMMLRKMTDEQLLNLPTMDDKKTSTAIHVLTYFCTHSLLCDEEDQAVYAALKAMRLTLERGLSPSSPMAFVIFGIAELTCSNHEEAYRFGKLALRLQESIGSKSSVCATFGFAMTLLTYRRKPLAELKDQLLGGGTIGFEIGDIVHATYCVSQAFVFDTILGTNLCKLEDSLRHSIARIRELGQDAMLLWITPVLQYVLNLQISNPMNWYDVVVLSGEAMNEDDFLLAAKHANHPILAVVAAILKCVLAAFFRYFTHADNFRIMAESFGDIAMSSYGRIPFIFCASFTNYELYRRAGKRKHLRKARYYKKALRDMVSEGSPDAVPFYAFASTMEVSVKNAVNFDELMNVYNRALSVIVETGSCHIEGLMSEQAGFDLAQRGYVSEANVYFERALDIYKTRWGSNAKYEWLLMQAAQFDATSLMDKESDVITPQIGITIVCDEGVSP